MGQKVHPTGIRLGISKDWNAKWFAGKRAYAINLNEDIRVRDYIHKRLKDAAISRVHIERPAKAMNITVHTARPGIVIGKKGEDIERLRKEVTAITGVPASISVAEIRKPELDARLIAEGIAAQLEKRVMFRRAMKRAVGSAMRLGALGIKVCVSGRLNGADIARTEWNREGQVPLHTLRADVDYGMVEAHTTYGVLGVKVWVYKGEVFDLEQAGKSDQTGARRANR